MPIVRVEERLEVPIKRVWDLVCKVEAYPKLMEPVRSVLIIDRGDGWIVSAWEAELKGSILKWTEREEFDRSQYLISYRQLDGDLEQFEGYWQLHQVTEDVTLAILQVQFEIGIAMLRDMLNPIAERAIRDNARKMLLSLRVSR